MESPLGTDRTRIPAHPSSRCVQFASSAKTGTSEVDAATRERAGKRGGRPLQQMRETVQSEHESVCVVGLGTVGAPTAEFFLGRGIPTYGCDLDPIALGRLSPRLMGGKTALPVFPRAGVRIMIGTRRSSAIRSVAMAAQSSTLILAPKGPRGRIGPGTLLMASHLFGRPSKSPSQTSDSTRTSGVVSRPCHSLASLKYSFKTPDRYRPQAGKALVGDPIA